MDRDEKIARLDAWMEEYNEKERKRRTLQGLATRMTEDEWARYLREHSAVQHEWQRQNDKKIIEELGLFDE